MRCPLIQKHIHIVFLDQEREAASSHYSVYTNRTWSTFVAVQCKDSKYYYTHRAKCHKCQSIISVCHCCKKYWCQSNQIWLPHPTAYAITSQIADNAISIPNVHYNISKFTLSATANWNVWLISLWHIAVASNFQCHVCAKWHNFCIISYIRPFSIDNDALFIQNICMNVTLCVCVWVCMNICIYIYIYIYIITSYIILIHKWHVEGGSKNEYMKVPINALYLTSRTHTITRHTTNTHTHICEYIFLRRKAR